MQRLIRAVAVLVVLVVVLGLGFIDADAQTRRLIFIFQILRCVANHAARVKNISCANRYVTGQMHVRTNDTICAERNVLINNGVRFYFNARINLRFGMNDSS